LFRRIGQKKRQDLTFLATIESEHPKHENAGRHFDAGAAPISGAAYTDQILTSDQQTAQRPIKTSHLPPAKSGTWAMLSVDQFLRLN
jgi:hypothetical protein